MDDGNGISKINIGTKVEIVKGTHKGKVGFVERIYPGDVLSGIEGRCTALFDNGGCRLTLPESVFEEVEVSLFERVMGVTLRSC